jgi:hypothetical protein
MREKGGKGGEGGRRGRRRGSKQLAVDEVWRKRRLG